MPRERRQALANSLLKKVASAAEAGRKCPLRVKNEAKKRSIHGVNEHFELNFDDASASAVVFQRAAKAERENKEKECGHGGH
jgi:hypothetical protein